MEADYKEKVRHIVDAFRLGTEAREKAAKDACDESMALALSVSKQPRKCEDCPYAQTECPATRAGNKAFYQAIQIYQKE